MAAWWLHGGNTDGGYTVGPSWRRSRVVGTVQSTAVACHLPAAARTLTRHPTTPYYSLLLPTTPYYPLLLGPHPKRHRVRDPKVRHVARPQRPEV